MKPIKLQQLKYQAQFKYSILLLVAQVVDLSRLLSIERYSGSLCKSCYIQMQPAKKHKFIISLISHIVSVLDDIIAISDYLIAVSVDLSIVWINKKFYLLTDLIIKRRTSISHAHIVAVSDNLSTLKSQMISCIGSLGWPWWCPFFGAVMSSCLREERKWGQSHAEGVCIPSGGIVNQKLYADACFDTVSRCYNDVNYALTEQTNVLNSHLSVQRQTALNGYCVVTALDCFVFELMTSVLVQIAPV